MMFLENAQFLINVFLTFYIHIRATLNLTKCEFLPRVRWKSESKESHGGDEHTRDNQVEEVVQGSTPDDTSRSQIERGPGKSNT